MMQIDDKLSGIDWNRIEDVRDRSIEVLQAVASDKILLTDLVLAVAESPHLSAMCEHYDLLDKMVLLDHRSTGARLRLHIFLPGNFDRPHDHRWTYTTLILKGGYRHLVYLPEEVEQQDFACMRPSFISHLGVGDSYTFDTKLFHSVVADPFTVSLILRGPAVKNAFTVLDKERRMRWSQSSAAFEDEQTRESKRMSRQRLAYCQSLLADAGVIDRPPGFSPVIGDGAFADQQVPV